ncbi:MAG: 3-deoxy-7-phosphoheptulonate synthase [Elusimicrobia bacterium CG_4_10_14_0_2_um_filter_56_8]|nr:MAG: 3-deoxy-7-phosphoheptulonate synthase [Elusimicrobia bacterium CG_4_10_14_0_2_um_filter_56_8]
MIIKLQKNLGAPGRGILLQRLARLLPGWRPRRVPSGQILKIEFPAGADTVALIENLPGVTGVLLSNSELCPLATSGRKKIFSAPLNFGRGPVFAAGPCAVEDEGSYLASAAALKAAGAHALRAALFKPRSSPYAFQGIGWAGLKIIARAKKITGLPLVTETTDPRQVNRLSSVCDVMQIGARNMRNYELLKEAGSSGRAVLLKRAMHATLREWLLSAEYLLKYGAKNLILCERGDSAFSTTSPGLDFKMMREAKKVTGLPVLVDPSHAAKNRKIAVKLALRALRSGADGLLIEASVTPYTAKVDGRQTITAEAFGDLAAKY